ncbi:class I SAM-dependent DNA methyltransferase [Methanocorpusculum sp.]|nr:class I SAM-dependent DNA methyltransferase [Methanocorpusculum sp.]
MNGGLFEDEEIEIPMFTEDIMTLLLQNASSDFDWSGINPTIFGAVFESTLNQETRRSNGMHYTSIENIHKVIDPLFLESLKEEADRIRNVSNKETRKKYFADFRRKLGELRFLDPACGSGNFLTETYLSLRRLENEILKETFAGQMVFDVDGVINVHIDQFYGIELNDFAVNVAKTALWIAEFQMMKETEKIVQVDLDFLPLKSYTNIVEGNALRMDWEEVVPKAELSYILGNPPFVGASQMNAEQKADAVEIFGKIKLSNSIDYVGAWYHKAAELIQGTRISAAFVSTNSITQGEQVSPLWKKMFETYGVDINFAYRTFKWNSEAKGKAAVHCVIIGFDSVQNPNKMKWIYDEDGVRHLAKNISPYLVDAPNVLVESHSKPISKVPVMVLGSKPTDDGNFILTAEEREEILTLEPELEKWIKKYVGSTEFINNKVRYCFWLTNISPSELRKSKILLRRVDAVRKFRAASSAEPTRKKAEIPHLFFFISHPESNYLIVPAHSSEKRDYIPIGFMNPDVISSNANLIIPNTTLYEFGVLTSGVHMAWVRVVCGRIKSDYRYSGSVVYNNFPFPTPTDTQREAIEKTAQDILDARALYPDSSLADLYDPLTMPPELRKAHEANDRAVEKAYGRKFADEAEIVAYLMQAYQRLVGENKR